MPARWRDHTSPSSPHNTRPSGFASGQGYAIRHGAGAQSPRRAACLYSPPCTLLVLLLQGLPASSATLAAAAAAAAAEARVVAAALAGEGVVLWAVVTGSVAGPRYAPAKRR